MEDGGDLLNEECAEALTRIGTPAVLHAVAEAFPTAEQHFRLYATGPLEHIHSDLAVETCLQLLGQEKDDDIRRELAHALLCQFAHGRNRGRTATARGPRTRFREQRAAELPAGNLHPHGGTVPRIRRVVGD